MGGKARLGLVLGERHQARVDQIAVVVAVRVIGGPRNTDQILVRAPDDLVNHVDHIVALDQACFADPDHGEEVPDVLIPGLSGKHMMHREAMNIGMVER